MIAGPRGGKAGGGGFLYHLRGFFYNIEFGIGLAGRKPASSERVSLHVPWGPTEGASYVINLTKTLARDGPQVPKSDLGT